MWKRVIGCLLVVATAVANHYFPDFGLILSPVAKPAAAHADIDSGLVDLVAPAPVASPTHPALAPEPAPAPAPVAEPPAPPRADVKVQVRLPAAYSPQPDNDCAGSFCPVEPTREIRFVGRVEEAVAVPAMVRMLHDGSLHRMELRLVPGSWVTESPVAPGEVPAFR